MRRGGTGRGHWRGDDAERGSIIVVFAFSLVALLVIAALVLDVGYAYGVSRQDQTAADLSAIAAARHLPGDPPSACAAGWDYLKANLPGLPSGAVSPCSGFPSTCTSTTAVDYTATSTGPYTVTFRYPVPDTDPLMATQAIRQPADGTDPCQRFAVKISHTDASFFTGVAQIGPLTPRASAVARHSAGACGSKSCPVANLVSLDPIGCVGIEVNGSSTTLIQVNSYTDSTGKTIPGAIAIDSNGTACNGGKTTVDAAGSAKMYAEPTTGTSVGQISLYAMAGDQATCSGSACNPSQVPSNIAPQPVSSSARVTRAPADDRYNCISSLDGGYPLYDSPAAPVFIAPCDTTDTMNGGPYIDELTNAITGYSATSLPPGFTLWPYGCTPPSGTYAGNWWIECTSGQGFKISTGTTVVLQGNVIFNGSVNQSGGELDFEGNPASSIPPWCEPIWAGGATTNSEASCLQYSSYQPTTGTSPPTCGYGTSSCASFVYINGSMTPSGTNYTLNFNGTFVYVAAGCGSGSSCSISANPTNYTCAAEKNANSLTSNSGVTNWVAPTDGIFKDLSLWSESGSADNSSGGSSTASFGLHGGGNTTIHGVFFTPCAQFSISGGFNNPQTAQFLTYQLSVAGGSQLIMVPDPQQLLPTAPSASELIR